jgi:hypothetical protein
MNNNSIRLSVSRIYTILNCFLFVFINSCSSPAIKIQVQTEKDRVVANHIKVQRMYTTHCLNGNQLDSTRTLINEVYYDTRGNEKCVYVFKQGGRRLSKICTYNESDQKVSEIWLGVGEMLLKRKYYRISYEYDDQDLLIMSRMYNPEGIQHFSKITYDGNKRVICSSDYKPQGKLFKTDSSFYENDSREPSQMISYILQNDGQLYPFFMVQYTYNDKHLLTKELTYYDKDVIEIVSSRVYNSNGLIKKRIEWDVQKELPKSVDDFEYIRYEIVE